MKAIVIPPKEIRSITAFMMEIGLAANSYGETDIAAPRE